MISLPTLIEVRVKPGPVCFHLTYSPVGSFDAASCRIMTDKTRARALNAIALTLRSENSVLRCRLVISASFGCFQAPGLSVTTGCEVCLTGVD